MKTITTNKYLGIDVDSLNKQEALELKRSLECDIAWVEHDLKQMTIGEETDAKLDELNIYKNLYKKVNKAL